MNTLKKGIYYTNLSQTKSEEASGRASGNSLCSIWREAPSWLILSTTCLASKGMVIPTCGSRSHSPLEPWDEPMQVGYCTSTQSTGVEQATTLFLQKTWSWPYWVKVAAQEKNGPQVTPVVELTDFAPITCKRQPQVRLKNSYVLEGKGNR